MEEKILSKIEIIKCNILQKDYKILSNIIIRLQNVIIDNEYILIYSKNNCMKNLNELIKKMNEKYNKSIIEIFTTNNILENNLFIPTNSISSIDSLYLNLCTDSSKNLDKNLDKNLKQNKKIIPKVSVNKIKKNNKLNNFENEEKAKDKIKNNDITINVVNLDIIDDIKKLMIDSLFVTKNKNFKELVELTKYIPFGKIKEDIILLSKIVGFTNIIDIIYLEFNLNKYNFVGVNNDKFKLINNIFTPLDYEIIKI